MKLGWTLALVCLVVGVNANAATIATNPNGSEGSGLFLTVWNGTNKSIIVDLGINAVTADFNALPFNQNFSAALNAAFGSIGAGFQYGVFASSADIFNQGIWTTHTTTTLTSFDIVAASLTISNSLAAYSNANPLTALGLGNNNGPAGITAGAGYFGTIQNISGNLNSNVPPNIFAAVNTPLNFYSLLNENFGTAVNTRYVGKQWLLSSAGVLTYSGGGAPVPLPAAIYMLGAALLGLVGIGRRRTAVNVA